MKSSTTAVAAIAPNNAGSLSSLVAHSTTPSTSAAAYSLSQQEQEELDEHQFQQQQQYLQQQENQNHLMSPSSPANERHGLAGKIQGIAEKLQTLGGGGGSGAHNNNKSDTDSCKSQSGNIEPLTSLFLIQCFRIHVILTL